MSTERDFLDEIIENATTENPDFPQLLEAAERARVLVRMLARAREKAGLTQAELARRMNTTQSAIARLEAAERDPRLSTVVRYAQIVGKALVLTDEELLEETGGQRTKSRQNRTTGTGRDRVGGARRRRVEVASASR